MVIFWKNFKEIRRGGGKMDNTNDLIAQLENTADKFASAIEGASSESLIMRPDEKTWAPVEIICHMRDVEEAFIKRFETILEIDDSKIQLSDADRWAEDRQYLRNDTFKALSAFRKRREETLQFLTTLKPEQWARSGIHPKRGRTTIAEHVELIAGHDSNHLEQLERALAGQA
jgi:uncharacterized damage-inducible protein DinB